MPVAAGYIRVSRDKTKHGQAEDIVSPDTQRDFFVKYAQVRGWELPAELIKEDLDYSGYRIHYSKRPGLMELMRLADEGKIQYLLIYKISRLSRRLREFLEIYEYFEKRGVGVVSVTESIDTSSPYGRAAMNMLAVFAQLQSEELGEYISNTKATQASQGIVPGTPPAYGIIRKGGQILKNPETFPWLEEMFRLAVAGRSAVQIRKFLEEKGARPPKGHIWHDDMVRFILRNPIYIGKFRFNGRIMEGRHEALIDPAVWYEVQRRMDARKEVQADKRHRLLSGLIFCGKCGAPYNVHHGGGHARRVGYQCRHRFRPGCSSPRLDAATLEEVVARKLDELADNELILKRVVRKLERGAPQTTKALQKEKARLERELADLRQALDDLFEDHYRRRIITADQFARKNKEFLEAARATETQLVLVNEKLGSSTYAVDQFNRQRSALTGLVQVWDQLPEDEIRGLLAEIGVKITAMDNSVVLSVFGLEETIPGKAGVSTLYFGGVVDDLHYSGPFWSQAQDRFLMEHWENKTAKWIADQLGKTERGVRQRVFNLYKAGLLRKKRTYATSATED